jgi:hypothetical protein
VSNPWGLLKETKTAVEGDENTADLHISQLVEGDESKAALHSSQPAHDVWMMWIPPAWERQEE